MRSTFFGLALIVLVGAAFSCSTQTENTAAQAGPDRRSPDEIYGDLFHAVQTSSVFPDGKTFVDCSPKFPADTIMARYTAARNAADFDLKAFVAEHFEIPQSGASDFVSNPKHSPAEHINALWEVLTRRPDQAQAGTLIPLPHPFIVPGGRFREVYYWDSYFTLLGLQDAGQKEMVRHIADNFAYLIDTIGFVPNGNRTYYLGRSQPPFFSMIVRIVGEMEGKEAALKYLPQLLREYDFWMEGHKRLSEQNQTHRRVVRLADGIVLNRYWDDRPRPRPESYREDLETAQNNARESQAIYTDLRAGAESGWDFSSRWLEDPMDLATIRTTAIIPVDLNALLFHLESIIAEYARLAGKTDQAARFEQLAAERKAHIVRYCWDETSGFFYDYDFENKRHTGIPSLAGMYPLFFKVADQKQAEACAKVIQRDFLKPGGVVTTLTQTGQQWDAPNGWAPLQWITIQGLRQYGQTALADDIRNRWVALNEKVYRNTGKMVEKYNVMDMTLDAGGGEYPVQDGFGWTNGVLLRLLTEKK
ncbi:MAG: alpha,alpha-trehalase TreF [Saprospiraceae bacterium]|nr:alpha,alpha-trehalase TreF [Saprospiraceae bacterium]